MGFTIRILLLFTVTYLKLASLLALQQFNYVQVPATFLSSFPTCSNLQSRVLQNLSSKMMIIGCLQLCSSTVNCNLACVKGASCLLSSALVAPYWIPKASVAQPLLPYNGYKCYSSWTFQNDLTSYIVGVKSSPQMDNRFKTEYAVDGYFCATWDTHLETEQGQNKWFEIDMGKIFQIQTIIVKARDAPDAYAFFGNVLVSVGNASGNGDYSGYSTFGVFPGRAALGQVITFQPSNPIAGRYVSFVDRNFEFFVIGEVKVIGYSV